MAKIKILQGGQSYIFRSYFELPYKTDDILAEFDYTHSSELTYLYLKRPDN